MRRTPRLKDHHSFGIAALLVRPAASAVNSDSGGQADRFFIVIKFWMAATSGAALALETGVRSYQVEDEEGRMHLLIHLAIEEDRWCLWWPDHEWFDSRSIFESALVEK